MKLVAKVRIKSQYAVLERLRLKAPSYGKDAY